ncbi:MAG TPA: HEPN domain-containing protein [Spirochaetia bacterium]
MRNVEKARQWLVHAGSNLAQAKLGEGKAEVLLDDLCFQAQQATEKALKALCVLLNIQFPRTHDIGYLIDQIRETGMEIPEDINSARILTTYAVTSRYPSENPPATKDEYEQAQKLASEVYRWVHQKVKNAEQQP